MSPWPADCQFPLVPLKFAARLVGEKRDVAVGDDYIGLERVEPWTGRLLDQGDGADASGVGAVFRAGDVLFGKLRPYLAKVLLAKSPGVASAEFLVLRQEGVNTRFLAYVLRSKIAIDAVTSTTYGAKMPRAAWEDIGRLPIPVPDARTQHEVADFLDRETARIDALVDKQVAALALLSEHRRAHQASVLSHKLADAGLGVGRSSGAASGLPSGWRWARGREVFPRIEQGWSPQCEARQADPDEWGVLKVGCVNGDHFDASENKALPGDLAPVVGLEVRAGDLLMSRANTVELVGSVALVRDVRPKLMLCDKLYRIGLRRDLIAPRFAEIALTSEAARQAIEAAATGASPSMKNISQEAVRSLVLPLPTVEEQERIADHFDGYRARHAALRARMLEMVERLREHRSALIASAVTGGVAATRSFVDRGPEVTVTAPPPAQAA